MTNQLESIVLDTVSELVGKQELFTALDVSNAVKAGAPNRPSFPCRHREVRDIVRQAYTLGQLTGYGRTDIQVTLRDGSKENALLYYPDHLSPQDIDTQYPDSRRGITPAPSPTVVQAARKMVLKPKMLGQFLANRAKNLLSQVTGNAPTSDGDDDSAS